MLFSITASIAVFTILDMGILVNCILHNITPFLVLAVAWLVFKEHGFRYSLRTLFVVLTIWAIVLATIRPFG